ncbi:MAG: phosphoribosyl carboxyaminoimidazole mutase [Planctomycetaceae bacterium]|nr:MAG: phosphoribosyl carboxyaminoimidazole mutase [Planctomycetaceae bacterium]
MHREQLCALLESYRRGECDLSTVLQAWEQGSRVIPADARLDLDRLTRCGYPEVVYGPGKSVETLLEIIERQQQAGQPSLITRVSPEQAEPLLQRFPQAIYHPLARTLRLETAEPSSRQGLVMILTAGTTDRPVAEEAAETARWMGCEVQTFFDAGVAGPQRLLQLVPSLQQADVLVVVAGMEGALPSVAAGWVACPVIAVPTSVGYGANFQGLSALLTMLNSCAPHVAVVNIDAGFKGGYLAGLIARRTARCT